MRVWQKFRDKLRASVQRPETRRAVTGMVIGLSLLAGIGIGAYRAWPAEEPASAVNVVTRDELNDLVQERVQTVIATLYPWVLDGPTQGDGGNAGESPCGGGTRAAAGTRTRACHLL